MAYKVVGADENGHFPPRVQTALNATYVPRSSSQIGLDTDGVPYFSSALDFASAVPVLTDTDGVPYFNA
jgi:hypothetical protein